MISIDFIPQDVQCRRQRRYRVRRWAVGVVTSAAAVLVVGGVEWSRRVEAAQLSTEQRQLGQTLARVRADGAALLAEAESVRQHVERAAALRSKRAWSGLFAVIGTCMPESCWLISVVTDPAVPGPAPGSRGQTRRPESNRLDQRAGASSSGTLVQIDAPRKLRLMGYAPDAASPHVFVVNLKETNLFARVTLERSQRETVRDGSYFRFRLLCEW